MAINELFILERLWGINITKYNWYMSKFVRVKCTDEWTQFPDETALKFLRI